MQSEYRKRVCGNYGVRWSFVTDVLLPDWWDDELFEVPSAFAELKLYTFRIFGRTWDQMGETPGDGPALIARTALRRFNPVLTDPKYDVPMLRLADAAPETHAFYKHEDLHVASTVRPVYAVVHTHPRLDVNLLEWARAAYLDLPLTTVSTEVAAFHLRVSGVSDASGSHRPLR